MFATQGHGGNEEQRILGLLERLPGVTLVPYRRGDRLGMAGALLRAVREHRPDLVVMEGSGLPGGAALLLGRLLHGIPYVVSSGDAVGPWIGQHFAGLGLPAGLYERLLYRFSAGFIGWTPYLVGRALTYGAPRAMTAAGWAPVALVGAEREAARAQVRADLGIPADALVVGIVGSLAWNDRLGSCYGLELVRALNATARPDLHVLIGGDGPGRAHLEAEVMPDRRGRLHLAGRLSQQEVARHLAAMDLASLPQTTDEVGSFRYTTKLSEYQQAGLPVITGRIPMSYDLPGAWVRIPGDYPTRAPYVPALAAFLEGLSADALAALRARAAEVAQVFSREDQVKRATAFFEDLLTPRAG